MIETETTLFETRVHKDLEGIVHWHTTKKGYDKHSKASLLTAYQLLLIADKMIGDAARSMDATAGTITLHHRLFEVIDRFEDGDIDQLRDKFVDEEPDPPLPSESEVSSDAHT